MTLQVATVVFAILTFLSNQPTPRLDVGSFPLRRAEYHYPASGYVVYPTKEDSVSINETVYQVNVSATKAYVVANFTFLIHNSGRGPAYDVNVRLDGDPPSMFSVVSSSIFVGEPLKSNLLDTAGREYYIGLLGAGKSYTIIYSVRCQLYTEQGGRVQGRLFLTVTSENAGTIVYIVTIIP